jgi:hypothetical protein
MVGCNQQGCCSKSRCKGDLLRPISDLEYAGRKLVLFAAFDDN